ncbi:hypothetical protein BJX70DRAFT_377504 [Aspergillus crustosus]
MPQQQHQPYFSSIPTHFESLLLSHLNRRTNHLNLKLRYDIQRNKMTTNAYAKTILVILWLAVLLGQAGYFSAENVLSVATISLPFLTLALHWDEW